MTITDPVREDSGERRPVSRKPLLIAGAAGAALVATGAVYAGGWTSMMGVRTIEVQGVSTTAPEQIIAVAGIAEGTPMMRVDLRAATARLADLPQVAAVDVRREWPRTVVLSVTERQAVATQRAGDSWELLDTNGVAFAMGPQKPKDLPTVERSPDEATNTAMLRALTGMSSEVRARVAVVSAGSPNAIRLTLRKGGAIVNWGAADQSEYKSAVLAVLLETDAGWYDVSNPDTPSTADAPPAPADPSAPAPDGQGQGPDPAATSSPVASPAATPSPVASPAPTPSASPVVTPSPVASSPAAVETPVGVVPQSD